MAGSNFIILGGVQMLLTRFSGELNPDRKRRGPRRLEAVPRSFQDIPGIHHVTTVRQLRKLASYVNTPQARRPPFIRLGCTVSHGEARLRNPPSSTLAVTFQDRVEIVHREREDPRSSWKWARNPARPWNIERAFAAGSIVAENNRDKIAADRSAGATYYIALVNVSPSEERGVDGRSSLIRSGITLDGEHIFSVRERPVRGPDGKVEFMELLVHGTTNWWCSPRLASHFFAVREVADGEVFSGSDGCHWVSRSKCITIPSGSWADMILTSHNREEVCDAEQLLQKAAAKDIFDRITLVYRLPQTDEAKRALSFRIQLEVRRLDLLSIGTAELQTAAIMIMESIAAKPLPWFAEMEA